MNDTIREFLEKNNIDSEKIRSMPESKISTLKHEDYIVEDYMAISRSYITNISIADVIGYSIYAGPQNIIDELSEEIDKKGDYYQRERLYYLNANTFELMKRVRETHYSRYIKKGPIGETAYEEKAIEVVKLNPKKYIIRGYSRGRYLVMRTHFLNETYGLNKNSKEYKQICEKYSFPAIVYELDYFLTYSKYLLDKNPNSNYGASTVGVKDHNSIRLYHSNKSILISREDFFEFVRDETKKSYEEMKEIIQEPQKKLEKFSEYIQTYFPEYSINQGKVKKLLI